MLTRKITAKRLDEGMMDEEVPLQVEQVEKVPQGAKDAEVPSLGVQVPIEHQGNEFSVVPLAMTNGEIRLALHTLARALTTHVNRGTEPRVNIVESTMTSRLVDFVRMNHPIFVGSKVGEDTHEFLNCVYKVLSAMGVTSKEKVELVSYQLGKLLSVMYSMER